MAEEEEEVVKEARTELVHACARRGHAVTDTLADFLVRAVLLDSWSGLNELRTVSRQRVTRLTQLGVHKLLSACRESLQTVRMQLHFNMNFTSRRQFLEDIHGSVRGRLSSVMSEITDGRGRSRKDLNTVYRGMVSFILQRSALSSSHDAAARAEVTAVLQRLLPLREVSSFVVLPRTEKEEQLKELASIVTGMLLFNRARGAGQQEATLLQVLVPRVLKDVVPRCLETMEEELGATQTSVWRSTAVLEKRRERQVGAPPCSLTQSVYNLRQHQAFLCTLQAEARLCCEHVDVVQQQLLSTVELLKDRVPTGSSPAPAAVYPLLKRLSHLRSELQDEGELLNILHNRMLELRPFVVSQAELVSGEQLRGLLGAVEVKTDEQRMNESSDEDVRPALSSHLEWLKPETRAAFSELLLQFSGFCGYTLAEREGLLLPGNPHVGVLKHKDKLFAFCSKEAAWRFSSSPDRYIARVMERAQCFPELIGLLKLQEFSSISQSPKMTPGRCAEGSTQTDLHPIQSNIVKSYEWNEWQLRRKALQLADLQTKVTHSVQTHQSHMRRDNVSQTWAPKDGVCQTRREGGSQVPRAQVYYTGLRGRRVPQSVKTDLTRPTDE